MSLRVDPVVVEDIPLITHLWLAAFDDPDSRQMFPDTPGIRAWWDETNGHDLLHKPHQRYVKVVDPADPGTIIAYVKWDLAPGDHSDRFPALSPESPREVCEAFFGGMREQAMRTMKGREHYYLDMLATDPGRRRTGAGSLLVRWGCELADQDGMPIYIDSSEAGVRLYEKFGFEVRGEAENGICPMVREARVS